MIARVYSAGVIGVDGFEVVVECEVAGGLNNFEVVGLPETAVKESRTRVRAAMLSCGLKFPSRRITVNLAPLTFPNGARSTTCPWPWPSSPETRTSGPGDYKQPSPWES